MKAQPANSEPIYHTDYVEIPLTHGLYALVSIEDAPAVLKHKWMASCISGTFYATRGVWNPETHRQSICYMHRVILGAQSGQEVDHGDRNSLDNRRWSDERRSGIRLATRSENTANRGLQSNNRSGYIGVRATSHGTFSASINHLDKYISLGAFSDPISAAKARDQRAFEVWGKFATLNFPLGTIQPSVALPLAA